jgi:uncharacterized membrane protein
MTPARFDRLDALRGLAMVWMTVFHFCFDLNYFGLVKFDFYQDPAWTWQRTLIVSLFLLCAGMGQAVAVAQGQSWQRFWWRWSQVTACAALVSLGSWWMYPQTFIYFGVLHGMAVMLFLVRLTAHWGPWLWPLGALAIASKFIADYALQTFATADFVALMNAPGLNTLGWITNKPVTEDYVPIVPWLGVMWWGMAAGKWLLHRGKWADARVLIKPLACLGRRSLSYYVLHQPVMISGLYLFVIIFSKTA